MAAARRLRDRLRVDPDEVATTTVFTAALGDQQKRAYDAWLNSSSISTPHSDEMVIAFKLAGVLGLDPTKVIRSLRGQRGQGEQLIRRLETIVERNRTLRFIQDGRVRRVSLVRSER